MSVIQDLRTRGRHRGMTPRQLIQKIGRLERAGDEMACQLVEMATEIDGLRTERNLLEAQLDAAGVELSAAREDCQDLDDMVLQLRAQLAPYLADKANMEAVTVPPMVRDTAAVEDQATGPIYVRALWEALGVGPVSATDPAHIPSWAETQEMPVVDLAQKEVA